MVKYTCWNCIFRHSVFSLVYDTCRLKPEQMKGGRIITQSVLMGASEPNPQMRSKRVWLMSKNLQLFLVLCLLSFLCLLMLSFSLQRKTNQVRILNAELCSCTPCSAFCMKIPMPRCTLNLVKDYQERLICARDLFQLGTWVGHVQLSTLLDWVSTDQEFLTSSTAHAVLTHCQ